MTNTAGAQSRKRRSRGTTLARVAKYALIRMLTLGIALVVGVYLTILIANMGGHVDAIRLAMIDDAIVMETLEDEDFRALPAEERHKIIEEMREIEIRRQGLATPFLIRSAAYLTDALSLELGRSVSLMSDAGSREVRRIILERLPHTLVLFGTAQLLLFFTALFGALFLSRRYGSTLDRVIIALAPTSAAPSWFYGIFLIIVFASVLRVLPFGGMVAAPPPPTTLGYALSLLRHLILPVASILIGAIFVSIYSWRTFFLIHSSEDYVEMARAKGLRSGTIERRHILRPTLPPIITSFALTLIAMWMGSIVLETIFNWPGLGRLFFRAIGLYETAVIVGIIVVYAYLLVMTLLLLDIIYSLVDPRVKVGAEGRKV